MNMTIQKKIKELQAQIEALKAQNMTNFNWSEAPIICELNGYRWYLGPEGDVELNWVDAMAWCESAGGELPSRDILLQAYLNEDIKPLFKKSWYWSSTEFDATYVWGQGFSSGDQYGNGKALSYYVRAVRKVLI